MSMIKNAVMGLMLASTVFAVGCNKAADQDAGASQESTTITAAAPVQAQAQTTVSATPTTANASTTVKASLGTTQYFNNGYNGRAAYDRGLRNGERLERPIVVNRPVVIERPGFFVRFANWRHTHGCKY
jgi:hypothetical protein